MIIVLLYNYVENYDAFAAHFINIQFFFMVLRNFKHYENKIFI